jgi:hypothetical protein
MSTAVEILDEREAERTVHSLAIACTLHTMCPECGHVDSKMETKTNHPCQKCGITVSRRRILFSTEEWLLEMIFECYKSDHSNELCVLLFCALAEQHLLNLLKSRCLRLNIQWPVMKLLLEGYEKVHERLKLFERLTGVKVREALAGQPVASVFTTYDSLAKKRNGIAHGLPWATYAITKDDIKAAVNAAADSFSCFAYLHHHFCAVDSPPLPDP